MTNKEKSDSENKLEDLRIRAGISQAEIAELMDYDGGKSTVSNLEHGRIGRNGIRVLQYAAATHSTLDEVFERLYKDEKILKIYMENKGKFQEQVKQTDQTENPNDGFINNKIDKTLEEEEEDVLTAADYDEPYNFLPILNESFTMLLSGHNVDSNILFRERIKQSMDSDHGTLIFTDKDFITSCIRTNDENITIIDHLYEIDWKKLLNEPEAVDTAVDALCKIYDIKNKYHADSWKNIMKYLFNNVLWNSRYYESDDTINNNIKIIQKMEEVVDTINFEKYVKKIYPITENGTDSVILNIKCIISNLSAKAWQWPIELIDILGILRKKGNVIIYAKDASEEVLTSTLAQLYRIMNNISQDCWKDHAIIVDLFVDDNRLINELSIDAISSLSALSKKHRRQIVYKVPSTDFVKEKNKTPGLTSMLFSTVDCVVLFPKSVLSTDETAYDYYQTEEKYNKTLIIYLQNGRYIRCEVPNIYNM